jgi:hypothetical protein
LRIQLRPSAQIRDYQEKALRHAVESVCVAAMAGSDQSAHPSQWPIFCVQFIMHFQCIFHTNQSFALESNFSAMFCRKSNVEKFTLLDHPGFYDV